MPEQKKEKTNKGINDFIIKDKDVAIKVRNLNLYYGNIHALKDINIDIPKNNVTAFIGPSGCGKSSLLRCFNRMNDDIVNMSCNGEIKIDDENILLPQTDVVKLRTKVGMVFQKPNPFPKSIFENIAYGPKIHGLYDNKKHLEEIVKESLEKAGLYSEVKDKLHDPATSLSGGQQQRLCIARAIAISPEIILMDEPTSALDPIATSKVEALIDDLRENFTIVIVTHSMSQAARVSQQTAFFYNGELIEARETGRLFTRPKHKKTQQYITGRFG